MDDWKRLARKAKAVVHGAKRGARNAAWNAVTQAVPSPQKPVEAQEPHHEQASAQQSPVSAQVESQ